MAQSGKVLPERNGKWVGIVLKIIYFLVPALFYLGVWAASVRELPERIDKNTRRIEELRPVVYNNRKEYSVQAERLLKMEGALERIQNNQEDMMKVLYALQGKVNNSNSRR